MQFSSSVIDKKSAFSLPPNQTCALCGTLHDAKVPQVYGIDRKEMIFNPV